MKKSKEILIQHSKIKYNLVNHTILTANNDASSKVIKHKINHTEKRYHI